MKDQSITPRRPHAHEELNLTPFIDVFVTLIVFLLLSAVFVHLGSLPISTPGVHAQGESGSANAPERNLSLLIRVEGLQIMTAAFDLTAGQEVEAYKKVFSLEKLADFQLFLEAVLAKEGALPQTLFQVGAETVYQKAVSVLEIVERSKVSRNIVLALGEQSEGRSQ